MSIKVWDYLGEYDEERIEILSAVDRVFSSGTLILGNSVRSFESEFSAYCEARYGIGVDNATNGLFLALKALRIGFGDEVITVSNTAVPTVSAIVQAGATPRFVDIYQDTLLMDVSKIEATITERTKCIIAVHLFGQCVQMDALLHLANKYNLRIIEDCSQSHGATYCGRKAGSIGDMGVFSFYPTKVLGGFGDGGMITTSNKNLNDDLRKLRFYGMKESYYAEEVGYNSRLDEVHAEILRVKLRKLDCYIHTRKKIAMRYSEILKHTSLTLPITSGENSHVYYVYVVQHNRRDELISKLQERNIYLNISYPWPIHLMRGYNFLGGREGDLPVTEYLANRIFSLPMYPSLKEEEQLEVCRAIGELLGESINE